MDSSKHAAPVSVENGAKSSLHWTTCQLLWCLVWTSTSPCLFELIQKYGLVSLIREVVGGLPSTLEKLYTASLDPDPEEAILKVLRQKILLAQVECVTLFTEHTNEEFFHQKQQ